MNFQQNLLRMTGPLHNSVVFSVPISLTHPPVLTFFANHNKDFTFSVVCTCHSFLVSRIVPIKTSPLLQGQEWAAMLHELSWNILAGQKWFLLYLNACGMTLRAISVAYKAPYCGCEFNVHCSVMISILFQESLSYRMDICLLPNLFCINKTFKFSMMTSETRRVKI